MPKPQNLIRREGLRLHDAGHWVIPCNGKGAIWMGWHKVRRTREELAEALADGRHNIGLVISQSPWIDIECDTPEAEENLQAMFGGQIPTTPTWRSRRGKHRLFVRPEGIPKKAVVEIDGIEFHIGNGKGAYSVIPPSRHPATGKQYQWVKELSLEDVAPANLPAGIVERLNATTPAPSLDSDETIPEGKRNKTLFAKAIQLKQIGLAEDVLTENLFGLNARLCQPPLPEDEVRKIAHSAATGDVKVGSDFVAELLREIELWHDQNDDPFATLPQGEHKENWLIGNRSRPFRRWVSKKYYDATGSMLGSGDLSDICAMLEGKAVFDGPQFHLFRRTAQHEAKFYLDLCEPEWQVVELDGNGWRVVCDPPVKFRRAKAMHPLPMPVKTSGKRLKDLLLPFLNVRDDHWPLVVAWLVAALRPIGPYPVLKLLGEQGSAKTTTARVLRALVDPNAAPVRAEPRSTRDLMIASNNGWILCLDNLSVIKADLSDAICRLATGGGFATRTLYTDDEESIFDAQRPVILTSIEEIGTRSDLLERSLIIELPSIPETDRKAEKTFWAEFEKVHSRILGALLDIVSGAIRRLPEIEKRIDTELPRLADFHTWGEAAEESFGLRSGTFAEAYTANREAATQIALESSPFIGALLEYLKKNPTVEDTAADLLATMCWTTTDETQRQPGWPKTPRVVSAILKRVAPNLRQIGITAIQNTTGGGNTKRKVWRICAPWDPAPRKKPVRKSGTPTKKKVAKQKCGSQNRKGRKSADKLSESLRRAK